MNGATAAKKICLGTAQLGLSYGVANQSGQPTGTKAFAILEAAYECGIKMVDTSYAYGVSEEVIGAFMDKTDKTFDVITKLPHYSDVSVDSVEKFLQRSLARLRLKTLHGYLIHDFNTYRAHPEVWGNLLEQKSKGTIRKAGFSVYYPQEIELLFDDGIRPDIVQLPFSVLDTRFAPLLSEMKRRSIEIYARSVFLQGAVFLPDEKLVGSLRGAMDSIRRLRKLAFMTRLSIQELCLKFASMHESIDRLVIGVDLVNHLHNNIEALGQPFKEVGVFEELQQLAVNDETAVVPSQWSIT